MSRQQNNSILVDIDIAIDNLLSMATSSVFTFLGNTSDIKQLHTIDNELSEIVLKLDAMSIGEERKARIIQIQMIQNVIDVAIKCKNPSDDSLNNIRFEADTKHANNQIIAIATLLTEKIIEVNNFKNDTNNKIELLVCETERLKNENTNMSNNIANLQSRLHDRNVQYEKISDLLRTEQAKNSKLNEMIRNKNVQIEELNRGSDPLERFGNLFGNLNMNNNK